MTLAQLVLSYTATPHERAVFLNCSGFAVLDQFTKEHFMIRLVVALIAFGVAATLATSADPPANKVPKDTCVQSCMACANDCLACMKYCRENKMEDSAKEAEICHHACLLCALAVQSKNPQSWTTCELCEKICSDCATVCGKGTDPIMKKCVESCRGCATACADSRK